MQLENYFESCAACGSRTIHFVLNPPMIRRHCAKCGRDNSPTWGAEFAPGYPLPEFAAIAAFVPDRPAPSPRYVPPRSWEELSNFERSQHFGPAALHD
jgi:hypothetical protein